MEERRFMTRILKEKMSEDFIRNYPNKDEYWPLLSAYQVLSESFIREFQNEVHWGLISEMQTLSESFIREFQNKVCWRSIFVCQDLSKEFRLEFSTKIKNSGE